MTRVGVFSLISVLSALSSAALQSRRLEVLLPADCLAPRALAALDFFLPFERFALVAIVSPPNGLKSLPANNTGGTRRGVATFRALCLKFQS